MDLSHLGVIVDILWHEIPNHSPFVELGDFVAMPNHIHGILILDKPDWVGNTRVRDCSGMRARQGVCSCGCGTAWWPLPCAHW